MKFTRGCSVAYWGCLLIALILPINGWSPANFPNPQTDPARCGRPGVAKSWVCDPDRILSSRSRDVVEGILKDIAGARDPFAQASDCGSGRRLNEGYQVCCVSRTALLPAPRRHAAWYLHPTRHQRKKGSLPSCSRPDRAGLLLPPAAQLPHSCPCPPVG